MDEVNFSERNSKELSKYNNLMNREISKNNKGDKVLLIIVNTKDIFFILFYNFMLFII